MQRPVLILIIFIIFIHSVPAATITWTGSEDSEWDNPDNWDKNQVPGKGDDVIIPADTRPCHYDIINSDVSFKISSLTNHGKLQIRSMGINVDRIINNGTIRGLASRLEIDGQEGSQGMQEFVNKGKIECDIILFMGNGKTGSSFSNQGEIRACRTVGTDHFESIENTNSGLVFTGSFFSSNGTKNVSDKNSFINDGYILTHDQTGNTGMIQINTNYFHNQQAGVIFTGTSTDNHKVGDLSISSYQFINESQLGTGNGFRGGGICIDNGKNETVKNSFSNEGSIVAGKTQCEGLNIDERLAIECHTYSNRGKIESREHPLQIDAQKSIHSYGTVKGKGASAYGNRYGLTSNTVLLSGELDMEAPVDPGALPNDLVITGSSVIDIPGNVQVKGGNLSTNSFIAVINGKLYTDSGIYFTQGGNMYINGFSIEISPLDTFLKAENLYIRGSYIEFGPMEGERAKVSVNNAFNIFTDILGIVDFSNLLGANKIECPNGCNIFSGQVIPPPNGWESVFTGPVQTFLPDTTPVVAHIPGAWKVVDDTTGMLDIIIQNQSLGRHAFDFSVDSKLGWVESFEGETEMLKPFYFDSLDIPINIPPGTISGERDTITISLFHADTVIARSISVIQTIIQDVIHDYIKLDSIFVTPGEITLDKGDTLTFRATAYDSTGDEVFMIPLWSAKNGDITWEGFYTAPEDKYIDTLLVIPLGDSSLFGTSIIHINQTSAGGNLREQKQFSLSQNYPNPFNPATTIEYTVKEKCFVNLSIYNVIGQQIETLVNRNHLPGNYSVQWTPVDLPAGTYFYEIFMDDIRLSKKMILIE